jgi:hypothetical protein
MSLHLTRTGAHAELMRQVTAASRLSQRGHSSGHARLRWKVRRAWRVLWKVEAER